MEVRLVILLITIHGVYSSRYDGYQVHRITPTTKEQLQILSSMQNERSFDFWKKVTVLNEPVDIMVSPEQNNSFHQIVNTYNMATVKNIDDVQMLIDQSAPKDRAWDTFSWDEYYRLSDIYNWLDNLPTQYPGKVYVINLGKSYEGRPIKGVKISFKTGNKAFFIEGGIHAREWISPATVTYMLNQILSNQSQVVRDAVEKYDWYVFPMYNPDGYEYSFINRLWRKSRQPAPGILGWFCKGVDLNRNWAYHWMENGGASSSACSDNYAGRIPFSAPETKTLSELIISIQKNLTAYLSFHSYGQYIITPYGDTTDPRENSQELMAIGQKAAKSLAQRYGTNYTVGNSIALLKYVVTGDSVDYVKSYFQVPITLTYELRDKGTYGFLLPPDQIIPSGQETFDSLIAIVQEAIARGY